MSTTPLRPGSPARVLPNVLRGSLARSGATLEAGKVLAIPDARHVTLEIGGQPVTVPRLGSYQPTVGEAAWCLAGRTLLLAIGAVGAKAGQTSIFDVVVGRGQPGDPAAPAATIDSQTILGGPIPATFRHLKLIASLRADPAAGNVSAQIRFNGDAGANYAWQIFRGAGAGVTALEGLTQTFALVAQPAAATAPANQFDMLDLTIADYLAAHLKALTTSSTSRTGAGSGAMQSETAAGFWLSAAAIARLALFPSSGNWIAGSRFTLYGLP